MAFTMIAEILLTDKASIDEFPDGITQKAIYFQLI